MEFNPEEYKVTIAGNVRLEIKHLDSCKWICSFQALPDPTVLLSALIYEAQHHHKYRHERKSNA